jgi:DNA repair exonuclease SbcCD ATPase subunit
MALQLEMGSGAEKTIASMAIRLALLSVSSLPKGDIFILDEPGTALDEENMEGFVRILDLIKAQFKTILNCFGRGEYGRICANSRFDQGSI